MDHLDSENEATLPSVFKYASSPSSDADINMIESESNSNTSFMPSQVSKHAAERDPDTSPTGRQTKCLRMTSPSSSITTSGPSSPAPPFEEPSQPYSSVSPSFYIATHKDHRSESHSKRKAGYEPTVESSKGFMKRAKLKPSCQTPLSHQLTYLIIMTAAPRIFISGLWRCCQCSSTGYLRTSRRVSSRDSCEHVQCEECDKKTADQLKRECAIW